MNSKKTMTKNSDSKPVITDFGERKVSQQNFSKIVALPKTALNNCGITSHVNVKLVQLRDARYIQLSPVKQKGEEQQ